MLRRIGFSLVCLWLAIGVAGCGKSKTGDVATAGASGAAGSLPAVQQEARDAAFAEIAKHFQKGPDGWTAELTEGSPYAPEKFLRQFREIDIDTIDGQELEEADKLNGVEWKGSVSFKSPSTREAGDPGQCYGGMAGVSRSRGQWSAWFTVMPELFSVTKTKGKWDVYPSSVLLRGELPTAADFARAGVK